MGENREKILIIGADGSVGSRLMNYFKSQGVNVVGTVKSNQVGCEKFILGLTTPTVLNLKDISCCIVCAGVTSIRRCEEDPRGTFDINVTATFGLIKHLSRNGVFSIFLSSNAIFDGAMSDYCETDEPCPVSEYGSQKKYCEALITGDPMARHHTAIIRLTKYLNSNSSIFRRAFNSDALVEAYVNIKIAPVSSVYLCEGVRTILTRRCAGIYHLSGDSNISYYNLLSAICRERVEFIERLIPTYRDRSEGRYPEYGSLKMKLTEARLGIKPQPLANFISEVNREIF